MKIIFSFVFYSIGFYSFFVDNSTRLHLDLLYYFWIFYFLKSNILGSVKGQKLIFFIIITILYLIPSISLMKFYSLDITYILFIVVIFTDILNRFSDNLYYSNKVQKNQFTNQNIRFIIYFFLVSWSVMGPFFFGQGNNLLGMLSHMVPSALSLIYLEGILRSSKSPLSSAFILFFHFLCIIIYLNNHWVGMGRIFLGFYILSPIMIYINVYNFSVKKLFILMAAPIALFFLQYTRYGSGMNLEDVSIGSAGYHLFLTDLVFDKEYNINRNGIDAFIDELKLFFLIWFPREFWVLKPIGISMWSVDIMFDRSSFINGYIYSQSIGFIGEQKLMLGDYYVFGIFLLLIIIIFLRKVVVYFSYGSNVPAIIFDLNLMSYFWGGMALFGSRLWFLLIPALLFNIIRYIFLSSYKFKYQNKKKFNL